MAADVGTSPSLDAANGDIDAVIGPDDLSGRLRAADGEGPEGGGGEGGLADEGSSALIHDVGFMGFSVFVF